MKKLFLATTAVGCADRGPGWRRGHAGEGAGGVQAGLRAASAGSMSAPMPAGAITTTSGMIAMPGREERMTIFTAAASTTPRAASSAAFRAATTGRATAPSSASRSSTAGAASKPAAWTPTTTSAWASTSFRSPAASAGSAPSRRAPASWWTIFSSYVTGGFAFANFNRSYSVIDIGGGDNETFEHRRTRWGWVAGVRHRVVHQPELEHQERSELRPLRAGRDSRSLCAVQCGTDRPISLRGPRLGLDHQDRRQLPVRRVRAGHREVLRPAAQRLNDARAPAGRRGLSFSHR